MENDIEIRLTFLQRLQVNGSFTTAQEKHSLMGIDGLS